ncbi:MAG: cation-translocating P-type ATPase [Asgard group archaeon]|nr:cation-translocating P-type ATPase [Asgard group archaeon]
MFKKRRKKQEEIDACIIDAGPDVAYHAMDTGEVIDVIETDPVRGLTSDEVICRQEEYGQNILLEKGKTNPLLLFLGQFVDVLILLLFIAAVVSLIFKDWIDAIVIFAIVIINGVIGFIQEYQAERSLEELKKMVSKEVRVIRDDEEHIVDSKELTVGDMVLIEAGEKVPADMRLVETTSLKVDESALTGESISLSKDSKQIIEVKAVVGDRRNMLFMGTTITYGRAKAVVVDVGMETEMGRIAALMQTEKEEPTPLQKNLDKLGKILGLIIVVICAIVFGTVIIKHWIEYQNFGGWVEALETALALAVSAVPEGLPAAITLTYAIGVRMMAKQNAIVSRLPAVETLGIVDVICSDKTGTLTKNEMTVTEIQTFGHKIEVTGAGYLPKGQFLEDGVEINLKDNTDLMKILRTSLLCNNAKINYHSDTDIEIIGDPTEVALFVLARKGGLEDEAKYPRELEIFFDSQRKRMTTVNRQLKKVEFEEDLVAYTKGSPPVILDRCSYISIDDKVSPLDEAMKDKIMEMNNEMASRALRVLAIAYRYVDERLIEVEEDDFLTEQEDKIETDLIFLGLTGMIDPARPEVKDALVICKTAGIDAVMVTGDQRITAMAIAKNIGLFIEKQNTISGAEIDEKFGVEIPDVDPLTEVVDNFKSFTKVNQDHIDRITNAFHTIGYPVIVTGDGIKDIPEFKKSDVARILHIQESDLIVEDNWRTVTGVDLEETTDEDLLKIIDEVKVFARVSPEHKHRIVSTFQEKGHTVATTGDGVNDAPAIKKAEIGVAMGIQGTDVTREAAQMVLADDNFATIVTAVERGRTIFQNMLKFIRYLIASNFDEIITVFVCVVFLGLKSPYTAIQILWINLVTDGLPAIALSVDPPLPDIMRERPRKKDEGFMKDIYIFSIIAGILAFASSMIVFVPLANVGEAVAVGEHFDPVTGEFISFNIAAISDALGGTPEWMISFTKTFTNVDHLYNIRSDVFYAHARTLNFTMSIVFEMFNVFITRSGFERTTFRMNPFNNPWIWGSIGLAMSLQMIAIYVPMNPEIGINNTIFDSMPMNAAAWGIIVGICIVSACLMELMKFLVGKFILKSWIGKTRTTPVAA